MFFNFVCIAINHIALIYCEELFVKLFAVPVCHNPTSKKFHQPPLGGMRGMAHPGLRKCQKASPL